tara:strand:+ start:720 stop:1604 length:885 start_codon:yes stop_codon:yes gene_type:complete
MPNNKDDSNILADAASGGEYIASAVNDTTTNDGRNHGVGGTTYTYADAVTALANNGLTLNIMHISSKSMVSFNAFLTSFSDDYKTDWESVDVYGRMDPIETFKSVKRVITVGWKVVSVDLDEAKKNLENCSKLVTYMYPSYTSEEDSTALVAPPMLNIKFANLIQDNDSGTGLNGRVEGVSYTPVFDQEGFHTAGPNELYPQTVQLDLTFHVLHSHNLGWNGSTWRGKSDQFPYRPNASPAGPLGGWMSSVKGTLYGQSTPQNQTPISGPSDANQSTPDPVRTARENSMSKGKG